MPQPPMPHTVTIRNPGASVRDPKTNNQIPGAPTPFDSPGLLQPLDTAEIGQGGTVLADWMLLLPTGTAISSVSTVTGQSRQFNVFGSPAQMESLITGPTHLEVKLKYVSDLQE